jgi:Leucine-rich repeat (LRR) protein
MTIRDFGLNNRNYYINDIIAIIDGEKYITHTITITDEIIELGLPRHSLEGLIARKNRDEFDHISDLTVFFEDKDIREIKIWQNSIDDLSPLTELHDLEVFSMGENYFIKNISPLGTLTKLKRLSLHDWHQVQDYSPIARLENLEYLFIRPVPKNLFFRAAPRGNFEPTMLQNMVHLKELIIYGITVNKFGFLSNLVNLEKMDFDTYDTDIDFIDFSHLTNLRDLEIHGNGNTINLEGIQHLKNLEFLRLEQFHVVDVRPLLELPNIKSITLWRCINVDTSPIENSRLARIFGYQEDLGDVDYR